MSVLRHDTRTTTLADAAAYERDRVDHEPYRDAPDARELAEQAADDEWLRKRQQQRDDAARARGEYVPSASMRVQASVLSMSLAQQGIFGVDVDCYREGVLRITADRDYRGAPAAPQQVIDATTGIYGRIGYGVEVALSGNAVWVSIERSPFADPFLVDGVAAEDGPPF